LNRRIRIRTYGGVRGREFATPSYSIVADLEITDTAFQKYTRYGMSLLKDLTWYFQEAGLEAKRKLLGSIFPAKLIFQDGKYRTEGLNPALAIILQKTNGLQKEKTGNIVISENVSGDVPRIGLEPTHLTAPEPKSGVSTNFTTWADVEITCSRITFH
jgi:site-specific DNA recombinase